MPTDQSINKALVPPAWRTQRTHGQIPGRQVDNSEREARAMLSRKYPKQPAVAQLFDVPVLRPQAVVSGLNLGPSAAGAWASYLEQAVAQAPTYIAFRQLLDDRAQSEALPAEARMLLQERAGKLWNQRRGRGVVQVLTPDQVRKARSEEPPESYFRKMRTPEGKPKYVMSEQEYRKHPDAHLSQHDEAVEAASHSLRGAMERAGEKGIHPSEMTELAQRHGGKAVAQAVREGLGGKGHYIWHQGRLHRRTKEHERLHSRHGGKDEHAAEKDAQDQGQQQPAQPVQVLKARKPEPSGFYLLEKAGAPAAAPAPAPRQAATPIGGVTPGGYKRVAEDVYVPLSHAHKLPGGAGPQPAPGAPAAPQAPATPRPAPAAPPAGPPGPPKAPGQQAAPRAQPAPQAPARAPVAPQPQQAASAPPQRQPVARTPVQAQPQGQDQDQGKKRKKPKRTPVVPQSGKDGPR